MIDFFRKHLKRIIISAMVVVFAVVVLSFASCGNNNESSDSFGSAEPVNKNDLTIKTDDMTQDEDYFKLFLAIGDSYSLAATSEYEIVYTSTQPSIAEVNENGMITAKKPGISVVYVTAGTQVKVIVVEVQNVIVPLVSVAKNELTLSCVTQGINLYCLNPTVTFDGKTVDCELNYSSTNNAVASVDSRGVITALSEGECNIIITANYNGIVANCAVFVKVIND